MESFKLLPFFQECSGGASSIADLLLSFLYLRLSKSASKRLLSDYGYKDNAFFMPRQAYLRNEWLTCV